MASRATATVVASETKQVESCEWQVLSQAYQKPKFYYHAKHDKWENILKIHWYSCGTSKTTPENVYRLELFEGGGNSSESGSSRTR